ncbi:endonuclease VII domain-containing protein [Streptomyces sp. NPDC001406]|uniref:endonuclease VII domain-containing protein n=1 Tax=Streptomyces sp. NPDC001406 TaxID=3364572 RepID=UPI00367B02F1
MTPEQREAFAARKAASVARNPEGRKRRMLRNFFNIGLEQYEEMHLAQAGVCAICGEPETAKRGDLVMDLSVDHDHSCCPDKGRSCGKCVRGLLCANCNKGLGAFRDDPERLMAAVAYLATHKSQA